ncbi:hypothetical protein [uncultured Chryseobacterium sp.]|uniref:hypothetical protein n=1 Tax=uncultured Chryseobacterium sp. TaxID=259322 RepID=UPI002601BF6D|nr:hypothetical protein [uncultured Chryseobacterium sp.]
MENLDENFFLLGVYYNEDITTVSLYSFKSGKALICQFRENNLINKEIEYIKMGESKPYYIYYEILRRKYPNYMNWKLFKIPKDSLK